MSPPAQVPTSHRPKRHLSIDGDTRGHDQTATAIPAAHPSMSHHSAAGGRGSHQSISIAVPSDLDAPFYLDMATSAVTAGKIQLAITRKEEFRRLDHRCRRAPHHRSHAVSQGRRAAAARRHRELRGSGARWSRCCAAPDRLLRRRAYRPARRRNGGGIIRTSEREVAEFARYLKSTPPSEGRLACSPGEVEYLREQKRHRRHRDRDATWDMLRTLASEYRSPPSHPVEKESSMTRPWRWLVSCRRGTAPTCRAHGGIRATIRCRTLPDRAHPEAGTLGQ